MTRLLYLLVSLALWTPAASADAMVELVAALQEQVRTLSGTVADLTHTVQAQAARIQALEGQPPSYAKAAPSAAGPGGSLADFNPEIGVIADITGQLSQSEEDAEGNDKLSVRELELIFAHDVDPYTRLDSTITFSDVEDPTIEEAYVTRWGLPGDVKARLGRMRPKIGKATAIHRDQLDTVDEPLVVQQYLGAEGLFRTGAELSGFIPAPWTSVTHEVIGGIMEGGIGEGGTLFGETRRRPSYYARLRNFADLSDDTNVEFGTTYLTGSKDDDPRHEVHALGLDGTLVHHVTPTNRLKVQSEAYLQKRAESFDADEGTSFDDSPWGMYTLIDYRLSPLFGAGGRWDYVQPIDAAPTNPHRADSAWTAFLNFYQSEFARWRLQFQHVEMANGANDNRVFLQGTFTIGVHKHQLQ